MTREQALGKLGGVSYGRVVFTEHALPAARLVHHVLDGGQVIIRTCDGAAIAGVTGSDLGTVVAYEADQISPTSGTTWSVVVTGFARIVEDPQQAARYRQALHPALHPGQSDDTSDVIIRINTQMITGYQYAAAAAARLTP